MMRLPPLALFALPALALVAASAHAQDRAEIDQTKIIGNRELPKVLYIVPWKKPLPGQLTAKPATSVLDEVLAPVDRDVFRRQVDYHAQVDTPKAATATSIAPVVAAPAVPQAKP
jgi:hypothetical protein